MRGFVVVVEAAAIATTTEEDKKNCLWLHGSVFRTGIY